MARDYEFKLDDSDFKTKVKRMNQKFPEFFEHLLTRLALRVMAKVKKLTPVDTGLLRRLWHVNKPKVSEDGGEVEIKNNAKYALAVEMGHKTKLGNFVAGRFMLRKGMQEMESQVPSIVDSEMQRFIDKQGLGR